MKLILRQDIEKRKFLVYNTWMYLKKNKTGLRLEEEGGGREGLKKNPREATCTMFCDT